MITRKRTKTILNMAIPITIGLFSDYMMGLIDIAMVGTLGDNAVAATGLSGFSFELFIAFVMGLAPAVQGIVARREGEGSDEAKCLPLNGGIFLILTIGIPLSILCYWLTPYYFSMISSDPAVTKEGIPYLRALLTGTIAFGMCAVFEGYWTGIARVKVCMIIILLINGLNIFLNYVLIFGNFGAPALGTMGAGIASAASMFTGTIIYFIVTFIHYQKEGFLTAMPSFNLYKRLLKMGFPASLHDISFSAGFIVLFWMIGQLGTQELSVTTVLIRVTIVMFLFAEALGQTSATLVSDAIGKGDLERASQCGWDAGKIGVLVITLLGVPIVIFPESFLSLFLSEQETISLALIPMQLTALTTGIASLVYIFSITLVTIGDGSRVMIVSFGLQWLIFLPAVWIIGPYLEYGFLPVWLAQTTYSLLAALAITALWNSGRWKTIEL
ncbi:MATE family efflux transporter [Aliikangiella coralliicola]|uniref:Multidrug-efflux transporter n=1 Tax=Aliikangiella coralliicola TaxID=2592383 RepID=A0A545U935_9GAMM|nr:MATE family efflux transporter [Aliikangiella coralliicola]TQV85987.1 MATE family efflux transporter [Aliikangiella coralliicola]